MIHSLHIGLNKVAIPDGYGGVWTGPLNACVADAVGVLRLVTEKFKGPAPELLVTGDNESHQPTKSLVRERMKAMQRKALPGDFVILSQSSHGDTDTWGQSLVLYDGKIYEEEVRSWLAGFIEGVRGIFIVDACFSGGLSTKSFVAPKVRSAPGLAPDKEFQKGLFGEPAIESSWAMFQASASDEPAMDGSEFGAWTGSVLRNFVSTDGTTQQWFDVAAKRTPYTQTPTLGLLGASHDWLNVPLKRFMEP